MKRNNMPSKSNEFYIYNGTLTHKLHKTFNKRTTNRVD